MTIPPIDVPERTLRWYAVSTRSRQEKVAAGVLEAAGVDHFLPLHTEKRKWSDRMQTVSLPLFPGYLFVHIDIAGPSKLVVQKTPGIVRLVGDQTGPLAIPEAEIENIQSLVAGELEVTPYPFLSEGDRVRVIRGPLLGMEGTLVRLGTKTQIVISIQIIHRSLAVTISARDIEPVTGKGVEDVA
jgi:transcription antitermination factor NusG